MAEIAQLEYSVGMLSGLSSGSMLLRDTDILVVKNTGNVLSSEQLVTLRTNVEKELVRLGVPEPKVLAVHHTISFEIIERP